MCALSFARAQQQQVIVVPDNLFTQAGFVVKYATTPEKEAILKRLPPDKLVTQKKTASFIMFMQTPPAATVPTFERPRPTLLTKTGQTWVLPAVAVNSLYSRRHRRQHE